MTLNVNTYPSKLLATEEKVRLSDIGHIDKCNDCSMIFWSRDALYTPLNEVDANALNFNRLSSMSVNLLFCGNHFFKNYTNKDDVKYIIKDKKDLYTKIKFQNDSQAISSVDQDCFEFKKDLYVFGIGIKNLISITDSYPFNKKGKYPEGIQHKYKFILNFIHDPNLSNVFHSEVHLYGNHVHDQNKSGDMIRIKGHLTDKDISEDKKRHLSSIISKVKNTIIARKAIFMISNIHSI